MINLPQKIITFPQKVLTWCLDAGEQRNWRVATFSSLSPSLTCDHPLLSNYLTFSQTVSHCLQCPPFNISLHSSMVWMCQNSNNLCLVWYPLRYPFSHYMHKNTFVGNHIFFVRLRLNWWVRMSGATEGWDSYQLREL